MHNTGAFNNSIVSFQVYICLDIFREVQSDNNLNSNSNLLYLQFYIQGGLCGGPEWQKREAEAFAPKLQASGYQVRYYSDHCCADQNDKDDDQYYYEDYDGLISAKTSSCSYTR